MKLLNLQKFTRLRAESGGYYDSTGKWVDGTKTSLSFKGSIQPLGASARELQEVLPEGVLLDDVRVLYTKTNLRTGSDRTGVEADEVDFQGQEFEVFKVDQWYAFKKLSHYKAYVYLKYRDA